MELTRLGLTLMLDGYGRGFGGLEHLRSLPFNQSSSTATSCETSIATRSRACPESHDEMAMP